MHLTRMEPKAGGEDKPDYHIYCRSDMKDGSQLDLFGSTKQVWAQLRYRDRIGMVQEVRVYPEHIAVVAEALAELLKHQKLPPSAPQPARKFKHEVSLKDNESFGLNMGWILNPAGRTPEPVLVFPLGNQDPERIRLAFQIYRDEYNDRLAGKPIPPPPPFHEPKEAKPASMWSHL